MGRPNLEDKYLAAFGKKIAVLRKTRGLTQEDLANRTGLHIDSMGLIERGKRWARLTTHHVLAESLGVKLDELFKDL